MKIAIISPIPVLPAIEGNRSRILELSRQLRKLGHEVHFLLLSSGSGAGSDTSLHETEFGSGRYMELPRPVLGRIRHGAKRAIMELVRCGLARLRQPGAAYHLLDEYFFAASLPYLRQLQAERRFDAVFVEYVFLSKAFEAFPSSVLKILDTHDIFADRHFQFGPRATPFSYWYSVPPTREEAGLRRADVVVAIQEEEEAQLRARLGNRGPRVATVSHALVLGDAVSDFTPAAASFIGSSAPPNVDALSYFVTEIMPRVLAEAPGFRLYLAGSVCKSVPDHAAIEKLGRVESVMQAYAAGPVAINPMRIGTGINIKLLEAMAHGVGTVSTQTGTRGLGAAFSGGVVSVAADDPAAFAGELVRLMCNVFARQELGATARRSAAAWNQHQTKALVDLLAVSREV